jgi:hypothetical protein
MRDVTQEPPAYKISVTQLQCTGCGAETHAACNCGRAYLPKLQRAEEIAEANPNISVRQLAEQASVSHGTAQEAKSRVQSRTPDTGPTVGRDGKQYPATQPPTIKSPAAVESDIVNKLAHHIIDTGYHAMADRFRHDQPTMKRLGQAWDKLKNFASGYIEF